MFRTRAVWPRACPRVVTKIPSWQTTRLVSTEGAASVFLRILIRAWAVVSECNVTTTTIPTRYAARGFSVAHATYLHRLVILWPWTIISCRVYGRVAMATVAIVEAAATFPIGMATLWVWHSRGWAFVRVTTAGRAFLNYNQKEVNLVYHFFVTLLFLENSNATQMALQFWSISFSSTKQQNLNQDDVDDSEDVLWKCNSAFLEPFLGYSKLSSLHNACVPTHMCCGLASLILFWGHLWILLVT